MRLINVVDSLLPSGGRVLDTAEIPNFWPTSVELVEQLVDEVTPGTLVVIGLDKEARAKDIATTFAGIQPGVLVLGLLPWSPRKLPVADVVQGCVDAGMQVLELRPLTDSDWDTAVILRRVDDDVEPIYAYLDPRRKIDSPRGRSLLRLIDEHVIESFTSRASELYMRAEHVPAGVAKQLAEAEARCAVVEARLQRLLASRSYRLAAGISSVWRAPTRVLGRGR